MLGTRHYLNASSYGESTDACSDSSGEENEQDLTPLSEFDDLPTLSTKVTIEDDVNFPVENMSKADEPSPNMEFIATKYAYDWLLQQLRMSCRLVEPRSVENIAQRIALLVPPTVISNRELRTVLYELDWDLRGFIQRQYPGEKPSFVVERIITLTGSSRDAQALTCAQYLDQTWPMTGQITLQLIMDLLDSTSDIVILGECLLSYELCKHTDRPERLFIKC